MNKGKISFLIPEVSKTFSKLINDQIIEGELEGVVSDSNYRREFEFDLKDLLKVKREVNRFLAEVHSIYHSLEEEL